ncbi:hypothetical protein C8Q75DRAFT_575415 [Abortiporus biennis]|nr:hypothetical protein C8Q75DRAFT_575415 [Abortiporus biennis]
MLLASFAAFVPYLSLFFITWLLASLLSLQFCLSLLFSTSTAPKPMTGSAVYLCIDLLGFFQTSILLYDVKNVKSRCLLC